MTLKSDCLLLFKNAIEAINPQKLVKNSLKVVNDNLLLVDNKHEFKLDKNVYLCAFGKAVNTMCVEVENILKDHFVKGIAIQPIGSKSILNASSKISVYYGARNNIPDRAAFEAAQEVFKMCDSLKKNDLLIACITGGGSALLALPVEEITLDEKIATIKIVASAGANITELNTVRGCLSRVKSGGLGHCAYPANIISLIISDVIGDPLDIIASGPTYITNSSDFNGKYKNSLKIIEKYELEEKLPKNVVKYLFDKSAQLDEFNGVENVKNNISNFLIGNNMLALKETRHLALEMNYNPAIILTNSLDGEAKDVAKYFVYFTFILNNYSFYEKNKNLFLDILKQAFKTQNQLDLFQSFLSTCLSQLVVNEKLTSKKFCILSGGETTVKLVGATSESIGGRNQEMALSFKRELINLYKGFKSESSVKIGNFLFTSAGTDGIDGPTDAAGAFVTSDIDMDDEKDLELMNKCLLEHNSYRYFEQNNSLIKVGHTGTNVSDIQILLVDNS